MCSYILNIIIFSWSICLAFFVKEELLASKVAATDVSVKVVICGGDDDDWVCSSCVKAGELYLVLLFDEKKMCEIQLFTHLKQC
jgi:hypothetical protein